MNRRKLLSGLSAAAAALLLPLKGKSEEANKKMVLYGVSDAYFPKDWREWVSVDAVTVKRKCACGHDSYVRYDWTRQEARYLPDYPKEGRYCASAFEYNEDICYDCSYERIPK